MKWSIDTSEIDSNNELQVTVLRLLCNLELANISMKWSAGEYLNRPELLKNEYVYSLSIYNSSVYETMNRLKESRGLLLKILTEDEITKKRLDYQKFKKEWDFLNSKEVTLLLHNLKPIRNESTFHVDPQPVKFYMDNISSQNGLISIVEVENSSIDQHGFSPLATEIIFNHFNSNLVNKKDNVLELIGQVYNSLRFIINTALLVLFNVVIEGE